MNTKSTFNKSGEIQSLPAPTLNIEPAYHPSGDITPLSNTISEQIVYEIMPEKQWGYSTIGQDGFRYPESAKYILPDTNRTLSVEDLNRLGNCQQTATYKWGFSFLLLFIFLIFFMVWVLGTYVLWLDVYLNSRLDIVKRNMGMYRAALDISSVIQSDLDGDIDAMTPNSVLQSRLKADKQGGRIGLQSLDTALPPNTRMMSVHEWGRNGGYSRWTPRLTLVITSILGGFLLIPLPLVLINILVLGHERQRALCRKDSQSGTSHHPLYTFAEGESTGGSRKSTSEATPSDRLHDDTDIAHVDQPSKFGTSTRAVEIS